MSDDTVTLAAECQHDDTWITAAVQGRNAKEDQSCPDSPTEDDHHIIVQHVPEMERIRIYEIIVRDADNARNRIMHSIGSDQPIYAKCSTMAIHRNTR